MTSTTEDRWWGWWARIVWELPVIVDSENSYLRLLMTSRGFSKCKITLLWDWGVWALISRLSLPSWNRKLTCTLSRRISLWSLSPFVIWSPTPSSRKGNRPFTQIRKLHHPTHSRRYAKRRARSGQLRFHRRSVHDRKIPMRRDRSWGAVGHLLSLLPAGNGIRIIKIQTPPDHHFSLW